VRPRRDRVSGMTNSPPDPLSQVRADRAAATVRIAGRRKTYRFSAACTTRTAAVMHGVALVID
jgi:hypothetical protein